MLLLHGCLVVCVKQAGGICPAAGRCPHHKSSDLYINRRKSAHAFSVQAGREGCSEENLRFYSPFHLHLKKKSTLAHLFPDAPASLNRSKFPLRKAQLKSAGKRNLLTQMCSCMVQVFFFE